jgi:ketosteroid isomerase-like protein
MQAIEDFLAEWAAAEQAVDTTTLERLLASDFTAVGPLGFTLTREAWLARHRHGDLRYEAFSVSEVTARTHGGTTIVIARNNTRGSYRGHPIPEAVRATLVLVNDEDRWRLAAMHMSFIAGTPGAPPIPGGDSRPGGERNEA